MTNSISIVIPNYNGKELLEVNLPFVYQALSTSNIKDYEIIVADDASKDDSVYFLQQSYPEIIIIKNLTNKGFAGNTNSGIKAAQKELVMILNSDVQLTDHYFIPLLPYFLKSDTFGVVGRIISLKTDDLQDGAKFPSYSFTSIGSTQNYISNKRDSLFTFMMSGANSLIDRKKLMLIGGYNELFNPYYAEDVDLSLTAWELGFKLYYNHNSICRHPNSATIKKEPGKKVKMISKRNKFFLHYLHLDGIELYLFLIKTFFKSFFRLLILDMVYVNSYTMFVFSISKLSAYKKSFKYKKVKRLQEVVKLIKADIENDPIQKF